MTRDTIALTLPDLSAFARGLRAELGDAAPGHQSLLNLLARAGGYRNYQHLRATQAGPVAPVDGAALSRALRWFDDQGRLTAWPAKRSVRQLCLWAFWAQLPQGRFNEREISDLITPMMTFNDPAQVRRSLVEDGQLKRNRDGTGYERQPAQPDATAQAVIAAVARRLRHAT